MMNYSTQNLSRVLIGVTQILVYTSFHISCIEKHNLPDILIVREVIRVIEPHFNLC